MSNFGKWLHYLEGISSCDRTASSDIFFRFIILWMSYNSYYSNKFPEELDRSCLTLLASDTRTQGIYDTKKQQILSDFSHLKSEYCFPRTFVKDMRVSCRAKDAIFDEQHDTLYDFLNAVYQVRCNLFHGDKTPYSDIDVSLVSWAYYNLLAILKEDQPDLFGI